MKKILGYVGDDAVGMNVALGNFDGDAAAEIVLTQEDGATSTSLIRVFDEAGTNGTLLTELVAFGATENATGGANVVAGR